MSAPFGTIVVCKSKDVVISSVEELCNTLNRSAYTWGECDGWVPYEDGEYEFGLGDFNVCNLTGIDLERRVSVETEKGEFIPYEEASDEQIEDAYDIKCEDLSIKEISELLSPFIVSGWVEIALVCNEKTRCVLFETLLINSDGTVKSTYEYRDAWGETTSRSEIYTPEGALK